MIQWQRGVAGVTLMCFTATQGLLAAPGRVSVDFSGSREVPSFFSLDIPADLATIDELYEAPGAADPKFILHIQDAHANYEAQMKIKQLLAYLREHYAIHTVFVEGASDRLDADYVRLFRDESNNRKLADALAKQGELSGTELYMLEAGQDFEALGIEDPRLYRQNYEALQSLFGASDDVDRFFAGFDARLGQVGSKVFAPEVRELLADWKRFEKGHREFLPFVRKLVKTARTVLHEDLESLFAQVGWPQISRLLAVQMMEKDLNKEKALAERDALVKFLREIRVSKALVDATAGFREGTISLGRRTSVRDLSEVQPRYLLEKLVAEAGPKGFRFTDYPEFSLFAGYVVLKGELDAKALFGEIEYLFGTMLDTLIRETGPKELLELYRDGELFRKLLHLELDRAGWRQVQERPGDFSITPLVARLKNAVASAHAGDIALDRQVMPAAYLRIMNGLAEEASKFYRYACQREEVFFERIQKAMAERNIRKAVVVTGGFHTSGLSDLFRENETSYGIVTPRLSEKSDEKLYKTSMLQSRDHPFVVSYIPPALELMSPEAQKVMGVRPELRLADKIAAGMGLGFPLDRMIQEVNGSTFAKRSEIRIEDTGKDSRGRRILKIFSGLFSPTVKEVVEEKIVVGEKGKRVEITTGRITAPKPEYKQPLELGKDVRRVLVVDDEVDSGELAKTVLTGREFGGQFEKDDVTAVTSGKAALELIRKGEKFDAVLSDINLGGMEYPLGYQWVQKAIADHGYDGLVVFMTGNPYIRTDENFKEALKGIGETVSGTDLLYKPISFREMVRVFKNPVQNALVIDNDVTALAGMKNSLTDLGFDQGNIKTTAAASKIVEEIKTAVKQGDLASLPDVVFIDLHPGEGTSAGELIAGLNGIQALRGVSIVIMSPEAAENAPDFLRLQEDYAKLLRLPQGGLAPLDLLNKPSADLRRVLKKVENDTRQRKSLRSEMREDYEVLLDEIAFAAWLRFLEKEKLGFMMENAPASVLKEFKARYHEFAALEVFPVLDELNGLDAGIRKLEREMSSRGAYQEGYEQPVNELWNLRYQRELLSAGVLKQAGRQPDPSDFLVFPTAREGVRPHYALVCNVQSMKFIPGKRLLEEDAIEFETTPGIMERVNRTFLIGATGERSVGLSHYRTTRRSEARSELGAEEEAVLKKILELKADHDRYSTKAAAFGTRFADPKEVGDAQSLLLELTELLPLLDVNLTRMPAGKQNRVVKALEQSPGKSKSPIARDRWGDVVGSAIDRLNKTLSDYEYAHLISSLAQGRRTGNRLEVTDKGGVTRVFEGSDEWWGGVVIRETVGDAVRPMDFTGARAREIRKAAGIDPNNIRVNAKSMKDFISRYGSAQASTPLGQLDYHYDVLDSPGAVLMTDVFSWGGRTVASAVNPRELYQVARVQGRIIQQLFLSVAYLLDQGRKTDAEKLMDGVQGAFSEFHREYQQNRDETVALSKLENALWEAKRGIYSGAPFLDCVNAEAVIARRSEVRQDRNELVSVLNGAIFESAWTRFVRAERLGAVSFLDASEEQRTGFNEKRHEFEAFRAVPATELERQWNGIMAGLERALDSVFEGSREESWLMLELGNVRERLQRLAAVRSAWGKKSLTESDLVFYRASREGGIGSFILICDVTELEFIEGQDVTTDRIRYATAKGKEGSAERGFIEIVQVIDRTGLMVREIQKTMGPARSEARGVMMPEQIAVAANLINEALAKDHSEVTLIQPAEDPSQLVIAMSGTGQIVIRGLAGIRVEGENFVIDHLESASGEIRTSTIPIALPFKVEQSIGLTDFMAKAVAVLKGQDAVLRTEQIEKFKVQLGVARWVY
nr:response regulator [Candidatus Omnitrophota bacterium]